MTIVTRRTLLRPYDESLLSDFMLLNICAKNRAEMNGPHSVASAKQLFSKVLHDEQLHCMAVLDNNSREYMGHVFIADLDSTPELGFIFDKTFWGQGYGSEALCAFFPKAVRELGLSRVTATANRHHVASIAILQKLGFELVSEKRDIYGPYLEFEFLAEVTEHAAS
ncbi:GNAT family N-acetyltransferase [Vibrio sp.]|uniref:GNAT family N-acetyltransferase n=1 Tax=Vibrio sp. TaxID=678 RepID=UPI003D112488